MNGSYILLGLAMLFILPIVYTAIAVVMWVGGMDNPDFAFKLALFVTAGAGFLLWQGDRSTVG